MEDEEKYQRFEEAKLLSNVRLGSLKQEVMSQIVRVRRLEPSFACVRHPYAVCPTASDLPHEYFSSGPGGFSWLVQMWFLAAQKKLNRLKEETLCLEWHRKGKCSRYIISFCSSMKVT